VGGFVRGALKPARLGSGLNFRIVGPDPNVLQQFFHLRAAVGGSTFVASTGDDVTSGWLC
jgi:hypothetical protein